MRWHRNQKEISNELKKQENNFSNHLALRRVRSSSFTANVNSNSRRCSDCSLPQASRCISLLIPTGKQQLFRRASVWNESPPGTLHSPFKVFLKINFGIKYENCLPFTCGLDLRIRFRGVTL